MKSSIRLLSIVVLASSVFIVGLSPWVAAKNLIVDPPDALVEAIDAAAPGDTLLLRAGTYYQSELAITKQLTFRAENGPVTIGVFYHCAACNEAACVCDFKSRRDLCAGYGGVKKGFGCVEQPTRPPIR